MLEALRHMKPGSSYSDCFEFVTKDTEQMKAAGITAAADQDIQDFSSAELDLLVRVPCTVSMYHTTSV